MCAVSGDGSEHLRNLRIFKTNSSVWQIQYHTNTYKYIQIHTNTYKYIQIHTNTYKYIQIHTNTYKYIQIHTNTISTSSLNHWIISNSISGSHLWRLSHPAGIFYAHCISKRESLEIVAISCGLVPSLCPACFMYSKGKKPKRQEHNSVTECTKTRSFTGK